MRPAFAACRSCHADDHGDQLAGRRDGGACSSCHTVNGWRPVTFTAAMHDSLRVTLAGKHATIECRACHGPNRRGLPALPATGLGKAGVWLRPTQIECASCHVDPHAGRFARGGDRPKESCQTCHDLDSFRPSTVTVETHRTFAYPLDGAHRAIPCAACHEDAKAAPLASTLLGAAPRSVPALRFTTAGTDCASCHKSPHGDQFAGRRDGGKCEACHGDGTFAPAERFDHDHDAGFALRGAHAKVACAACHKTEPGPQGRPMVRYRPLSAKCESCHLQGAG